MSGQIEVLGTDLFRDQHHAIAEKLHKIEDELTRLRTSNPSWRAAAPAFRQLLTLLEGELAAQMDHEEHALYTRLREVSGVLSPTLAACYREHGRIRLGTEKLYNQLVRTYAGQLP